MPIGWQELLIVLVIVLIIFGAGRLAGVGGALGKSVREFRQSALGDEEERPTVVTGSEPATPERAATSEQSPTTVR
ncbi:MAG: twin-arginine translocase TatA/TatE family subunit [Chloroflexi bacterium]|nr:twin-arginine translocase TatA/TatE family subunit [Chloroflexota bacterium]HEV8053465.1 twin-arginine translocase TatA/TatE family subunit [Candidatus Limnocylindrales bacterium]